MTTTRAADVRQPLLRPAEFGDFRLPNRTVVAPATRARADNPGLAPTALHAAYYAQRASAGLVLTEGTWVSERAIGFANVPGIFTEEQVAGWRQVTETVHAAGGRILLQLWHTGAAAHPDLLGGEVPAGPSAVNPDEMCFTLSGFQPTVTPREMTPADIAATVADYGRAAENGRRAGFDGVEIHAIGPYLIPQFLNPRLNLRQDGYGGDAARRRRFLLDVVDAVAEPYGGRCVGVRLSPYWNIGDLFDDDESTLAEYDALVSDLNEHPVSYLHVRGRDPGPGQGPDLAAFARYRQRFHGPMIANNGFDRESANAVVEGGLADAVSFARHFIANPDLVTRFALRRELSPGDPDTYYTGGAAGYVDYRLSDWTDGSR
jgi:N-ethylmaleimide reductase